MDIGIIQQAPLPWRRTIKLSWCGILFIGSPLRELHSEVVTHIIRVMDILCNTRDYNLIIFLFPQIRCSISRGCNREVFAMNFRCLLAYYVTFRHLILFFIHYRLRRSNECYNPIDILSRYSSNQHYYSDT